MKQHFSVIVRRGPGFDQAKSSKEQRDYEPHAAHWRELEANGFVAMAGLMLESMEVLFIIRAQSVEEVRERIGADPWQHHAIAEIVRIEPIDIRFGAPEPFAGNE